MRHLPQSNYCGLTIVLSNPSRFDIKEGKLLSGYAGIYLEQDCLNPLGISKYECDIRTSDTKSEGLLNKTKSILLCGNRSFTEWPDKKYSSYSLGEQRGYLLESEFRIPLIATFSPQDCMDIKDYESKHNPLLQN